MTERIKTGFDHNLITIALSKIYPTKNISSQVKHGKKYQQIISSIQVVGLIEPPAVTPFKDGAEYLLLDGHLRIMALKQLGYTHVDCLISKDDEAYTYNKYISKLTAVQEHRMIVKALKAGVSEEKLAQALHLETSTIRSKSKLLDGICSEVVEILKDKAVSDHVFRILKRLKAPRQIVVATLMNDQNRFSAKYAQALLDATPQELLENKKGIKKGNPMLLARQARLEEENLALSQDIEVIKANYGAEIVDITSVQAYLKRLLENNEVAAYLYEYHETIHEKFNEIVGLTFYTLASAR